MNEKRNISLFIDKRAQGIIQPNRTFASVSYSDFYITIALFKDMKLTDDYVQTFRDQIKNTIGRQNINPFFNELGFFKTIEKIGENDDKFISSIKGKSKIYNIEINS